MSAPIVLVGLARSRRPCSFLGPSSSYCRYLMPSSTRRRSRAALLQHQHPVAHLAHRPGGVADVEQGRAAVADLLHPRQALLLEGPVPHREHLVGEEDVGVDVDGDREAEPGGHARTCSARPGCPGTSRCRRSRRSRRPPCPRPMTTAGRRTPSPCTSGGATRWGRDTSDMENDAGRTSGDSSRLAWSWVRGVSMGGAGSASPGFNGGSGGTTRLVPTGVSCRVASPADVGGGGVSAPAASSARTNWMQLGNRSSGFLARARATGPRSVGGSGPRFGGSRRCWRSSCWPLVPLNGRTPVSSSW